MTSRGGGVANAKKSQQCLHCREGEIVEEVRDLRGQKSNWRYCSNNCGYLVCIEIHEKKEACLS